VLLLRRALQIDTAAARRVCSQAEFGGAVAAEPDHDLGGVRPEEGSHVVCDSHRGGTAEALKKLDVCRPSIEVTFSALIPVNAFALAVRLFLRLWLVHKLPPCPARTPSLKPFSYTYRRPMMPPSVIKSKDRPRSNHKPHAFPFGVDEDSTLTGDVREVRGVGRETCVFSDW